MGENLCVTIEKFLSFWSQHNTTIIEGLVALVILLALFLAYRSFFSKKEDEASGGLGGSGVDAAQLEKTLQKILEGQQGTHAAAPRSSESAGSHATAEGESAEATEAAAESAAEVAQLRLTLGESYKKIETLQEDLRQALEAQAQGGPVQTSDTGLSAQEKEEWSGKVRDLEARLAEYEIISEDIADLSKYREENDQLKKELEAVKSGGGGVSAPPAPSAPPAASEPPPSATPPPADAVSSEPEPEPAVAPEVSEVMDTGEPAAEGDPSANLIDDDLMKEFAAAVEGQKTLTRVADKAGTGKETPDKNTKAENDQLMNEFENFVTKKS
ncbi:MAG: hypothetical protein AAGB31_06245 [Bdellovibrio sp.]